MTSPAASLNAISDILEQTVCCLKPAETYNTPIQEYEHGFDDRRRLSYVSVKVQSDALDQGGEPTRDAGLWIRYASVRPGDILCHVIPIKLGGPGYGHNVFPLNEKIDINEWNNAQDAVYNYLKESEDRYAYLQYGFVFDDKVDKRKMFHPVKVYYHFALHDKNGSVAQELGGMLDNWKPVFVKRKI
ncbi:hypothetical protein M3Y97_00946500 [Aphelenchoides bicaudatus]|nr:hypothetical protein M3Y97_00946500 [Aphelenchoides bicaudatus]